MQARRAPRIVRCCLNYLSVFQKDLNASGYSGAQKNRDRLYIGRSAEAQQEMELSVSGKSYNVLSY